MGSPAFALATLPVPGEVAQLVEHTAENRGVAGSSPALAIPLVPPPRRLAADGQRDAREAGHGDRAVVRDVGRESTLRAGPDARAVLGADAIEHLRRASATCR